MHLSQTLCIGFAVFTVVGFGTAKKPIGSEVAFLDNRISTFPVATPIADLLPPTTIFDNTGIVEETAHHVVFESKRVLNWCRHYLHNGRIRASDLTWSPEVGQQFAELNSLCTKLVPLQFLDHYCDFDVTEHEVSLANKTMNQYHETKTLAAGEFLMFHASELQQKAHSVSTVFENYRLCVDIFARLHSISYDLHRMCIRDTGEQCWSTSELRKHSRSHADGGWSKDPYQQALQHQQHHFAYALNELHSKLWVYRDRVGERLTTLQRDFDVRISNVILTLGLDHTLEPGPVSQLIVTTLERGQRRTPVEPIEPVALLPDNSLEHEQRDPFQEPKLGHVSGLSALVAWAGWR
ncbi:hypothetical protein LTR36_007712 [Oleoguttula mirabilis]|uniref:Uncharacterized protein n=1 Tax=Oleoguttula mirabilis TaxID=1507867 RepID=A0AAV9JU66_9PEZI|nr:hypothetical protein LTR36_007712 [Oleoguttula mirabilis]